MNIAIIGPSQSREHAIGERLREEGNTVYFTGGNSGTQETGINLGDGVHADSLEGVAQLGPRLSNHDITHAAIGSENQLVLGAADALRSARIRTNGAGVAGARLETSKIAGSLFAIGNNIPWADFLPFSNADIALAAYDPRHYVVKDDGLAGGKGVEASFDRRKGEAKIRDIIERGRHGMLQRRLGGERLKELSAIALCHGTDAVLLPLTRDYKRIDDEEKGENTGGTGAVTPVTDLPPGIESDIMERFILPTTHGLVRQRMVGEDDNYVVYAGLIITEEGLVGIEYNMRNGSPEAQVQIPQLDEELTQLMFGDFESHIAKIKPGAAVGVNLMAKGYPGEYEQGVILDDLLEGIPGDVQVFHGNTKWAMVGDRRRVVSCGGRVVTLVAQAESVTGARSRVYEAIGEQDLLYYRKTIGMV